MEDPRKPFTSERFAEIVKQLRDEGKEPQVVLMSSLTYADVRKWGRESLTVIKTQTDEIKRGQMAESEGIVIGLHKEIPRDVLCFYEESFYHADLGELDSKDIRAMFTPVQTVNL